VTVVPTKVKIGVQQRRIILLFISCRVVTLFVIDTCRIPASWHPQLGEHVVAPPTLDQCVGAC
jgi:hypothetical protein